MLTHIWNPSRDYPSELDLEQTTHHRMEFSEMLRISLFRSILHLLQENRTACPTRQLYLRACLKVEVFRNDNQLI